MSHSPEESLQDSASEIGATSARILQFERPPNDLQRAVRLRAQEALERDRERSTRRPAPLRWLIVFALALIPVVLLFSAVDAFVRAFQHINAAYSTAPAPSAAESPQPLDEPYTSEPGVVMLQSLPKQAAEPAPNNATELAPANDR